MVAGVDIGGTKTAVGLVDADGHVAGSVVAPTPGTSGPAAIIGTAVRLVRELAGSHGVEPRAVGVGSAGVVDTVSGAILSSTDVLTDWAGTDLRGELGSALGVPVAVDNDVHAHALGEVWRGAAQGFGNVLFVAAGTGVGASVVLDGRILHGAHSVAGHAGHVPSVAAGVRACTCGARGHLEAVAAGPAMVAEYRRRTGRAVDGLAEVVGLAGADPEAAAVVVEGGAALGAMIGGLVNVLDPDLVVVSGGVAGAGPLWWDPLRAAVLAEVLPTLRETPVVPATLGGDAAVIGAARLAWEVAR